MNAGSNHVGRTGDEKAQYTSEEIHADQFLKLGWMVFKALDNARDAEGRLLHNTLIVAIEDVEECWHDIANHRERILGDVAATVCCGGDGSPLRACG
ncbi:hypothetical protein C3007_09860, partial [Avibacterium gallinarum]